jgi:hypothetical protein
MLLSLEVTALNPNQFLAVRTQTLNKVKIQKILEIVLLDLMDQEHLVQSRR